MSPDTPIDIFLGLDVSKSEHHALRLKQGRHENLRQPPPQLESELATLFDDLQTHGTVLVIVDQPNTIGALAYRRLPANVVAKSPICQG